MSPQSRWYELPPVNPAGADWFRCYADVGRDRYAEVRVVGPDTVIWWVNRQGCPSGTATTLEEAKTAAYRALVKP